MDDYRTILWSDSVILVIDREIKINFRIHPNPRGDYVTCQFLYFSYLEKCLNLYFVLLLVCMLHIRKNQIIIFYNRKYYFQNLIF